MDRSWVVDVVARLPQGWISRGWGWLARRRKPEFLATTLKHAFVRATGIDLGEAGTTVGDYTTLEALFTRGLPPQARPVEGGSRVVVSPVDGRVGMCGTVEEGTLFQAKGRSYGLADLLRDSDQAARFEGGAYATFYLAPHNYHRIHAPVSGKVTQATVVPGGLMPVFPESLNKVEALFARNERLITYLDAGAAGTVAVVKVGATLVGRISVTYDPTLRTQVGERSPRHRPYDVPPKLNKGAHLGTFELGSTVVLVATPGRIDLGGVNPGDEVKMGVQIGTLKAARRRKKNAVAISASE